MEKDTNQQLLETNKQNLYIADLLDESLKLAIRTLDESDFMFLGIDGSRALLTEMHLVRERTIMRVP